MKAQALKILAAAKLMLLPSLLVLPALAQAQFTFTTNDDQITITAYTGSGSAVNIPITINGYPVTSIGESAFYRCTSLTSVAIPASVTSIGEDAFGVCSYLTSITISNGVTSIGGGAFDYCNSLASVTIPVSVTNIGDGVFDGSSSLTNITVAASNPDYSSLDGVLFDKAQVTLLEYPGGLHGGYMVPASVTSIGIWAFIECNNLNSVTISNGVTSIGEGAFLDCSSLTNITVAASNPNYSSSNGVLFDKVQVTLLQYPGGVHGGYIIPTGVTSIGTEAFSGCINLTSVTIPASVTNIEDSAFFYCSSLTNVTIPAGVIRIGYDAFEACSSLTNVTIPNSVMSIEDGAFGLCTGLSSFTIPASVTMLGSYAFEDCTNLKRVFFQGNSPTPTNDSTIFSGDNPGTVYYLPGTKGWSTLFDGWATVLWNPQPQTSDGSFGVRTNCFGFNLAGTSNLVVVVEAATNLAMPSWFPVSTNTLSGGTSYFSDPQWTNYPARFYRLTSP